MRPRLPLLPRPRRPPTTRLEGESPTPMKRARSHDAADHRPMDRAGIARLSRQQGVGRAPQAMADGSLGEVSFGSRLGWKFLGCKCVRSIRCQRRYRRSDRSSSSRGGSCGASLRQWLADKDTSL